jgi:hypothetical protein
MQLFLNNLLVPTHFTDQEKYTVISVADYDPHGTPEAESGSASN